MKRDNKDKAQLNEIMKKEHYIKKNHHSQNFISEETRKIDKLLVRLIGG